MDTPENFQMQEGYACYRPVRQASFSELGSLIGPVFRYCYDHQIKHLLLDARQVTGFQPPSVLERYNLASEMAHLATGYLKIALLVHKEMMDPRRPGVTVARNRGLNLEAFGSEPEALAWLLDPQTG
jgi:hypothetical protein